MARIISTSVNAVSVVAFEFFTASGCESVRSIRHCNWPACSASPNNLCPALKIHLRRQHCIASCGQVWLVSVQSKFQRALATSCRFACHCSSSSSPGSRSKSGRRCAPPRPCAPRPRPRGSRECIASTAAGITMARNSIAARTSASVNAATTVTGHRSPCDGASCHRHPPLVTIHVSCREFHNPSDRCSMSQREKPAHPSIAKSADCFRPPSRPAKSGSPADC